MEWKSRSMGMRLFRFGCRDGPGDQSGLEPFLIVCTDGQ